MVQSMRINRMVWFCWPSVCLWDDCRWFGSINHHSSSSTSGWYDRRIVLLSKAQQSNDLHFTVQAELNVAEQSLHKMVKVWHELRIVSLGESTEIGLSRTAQLWTILNHLSGSIMNRFLDGQISDSNSWWQSFSRLEPRRRCVGYYSRLVHCAACFLSSSGFDSQSFYVSFFWRRLDTHEISWNLIRLYYIILLYT